MHVVLIQVKVSVHIIYLLRSDASALLASKLDLLASLSRVQSMSLGSGGGPGSLVCLYLHCGP